MKRHFLLSFVFIFLCVSSGFAADIPKGLVDSKPDNAVLINLDDWYAKHPSPGKPGIVSDTVFTSPRSLLMIRTAGKGTSVGSHYHASSDEMVIIVGGSAELLINGKWTPVKTGDVHVNPRGNVHDLRALNEDVRFISIFSPQLPPGGDTSMVK